MSLEIHSKILQDNPHYKLAKIRAIRAREKYEIKNGPLTEPVFNYLEKENCIVVTYDLGKKTSVTGMYIKKGDTKLVLIHKNRVLGQQNFTGAHELSHVLFDENDMLDICLPPQYKKDDQELLADFFASHFLMPEEDILNEYSWQNFEIRKEHIVILSAKYKVSFIAMALRMYALGLISREDYIKYNKESRKGKLRTTQICEREGLDSSVYKAPKESYISSNYFDLLVSVYHKANISRSVLKNHFLKFLEEKLKDDFSNILTYADDTYPNEVEWDQL